MTLPRTTPRAPGGTLRMLVTKGEMIIDAAIAAKDLAIASTTLERVAKACGYWTDGKASSSGAAASSGAPSPSTATTGQVVVYGAQPVTADEWTKMFATST